MNRLTALSFQSATYSSLDQFLNKWSHKYWRVTVKSLSYSVVSDISDEVLFIKFYFAFWNNAPLKFITHILVQGVGHLKRKVIIFLIWRRILPPCDCFEGMLCGCPPGARLCKFVDSLQSRLLKSYGLFATLIIPISARYYSELHSAINIQWECNILPSKTSLRCVTLN